MPFSSNRVTYAGIPFVLDKVLPALPRRADRDKLVGEGQIRSVKPLVGEPEWNLIDYLNSILPAKYLNDFVPPSQFGGRNIGAIARPWVQESPNRTVGIGEWFYPTGASRWSVFRGLATSTQVKAMAAAAYPGATTANALTMVNSPIAPDNPGDSVSAYTVTSPMYMLPPRPLAEHGGACEGLYLCTFVDERYYWQFRPATLTVYYDTTWTEIVTALAAALNASFTAVVDPIFLKPEADSPLWCSCESAAELLDAVAANIALTVVRKLTGSFSLENSQTSYNQAVANRGSAATVVRYAGGDMFYGGGKSPVGSLNKAKEAVIPASVKVTFPQYVTGDDPVPHLVNGRYFNQRPSCQYEESYGDVFVENVPILSGDTVYAPGGSILAGRTGKGTYTLHTTAKALYPTMDAVLSNADPDNIIDLRKLAVGMVKDYYAHQATLGWDESYPGTYNWVPEGFNDIVWTHSAVMKQATTRVMRAEWNSIIREYSHATPPPPYPDERETNHPRGVGGPSVAQSAKDEYSLGSFSNPLLCATLLSGSMTAYFTTVDNLPTQNRWRGKIETEKFIFDGSSGGIREECGWKITIAKRFTDCTLPATHPAGSVVSWTMPDHSYGNNLYTFEHGFFCHQGAWTDTGIQEARIPCPIRSVRVLCDMTVSGIPPWPAPFYSGEVLHYDPKAASGAQFTRDTLIWIGERNNATVYADKVYDGQLVGYSVSGKRAPIYVINECPPKQVTCRDEYNLSVSYGASSVDSGGLTVGLDPISYLPTQNRWVGTLGSEQVLFDGTSGGHPGFVTIAQRGLNGTTQEAHGAGGGSWLLPDAVSGVVQTTYAKGFFVHPGSWSGVYQSGMPNARYVREAVLLCPLRTVEVLCGSGELLNGVDSFSGKVTDYTPQGVSGAQFPKQELIWVQDRNGVILLSGKRYDGQLVAYSLSFPGTTAYTAPTYVVNETTPKFTLSGTNVGDSCTPFYGQGLTTNSYETIAGLYSNPLVSGVWCGLRWWGSVKNISGANSMEAQIIWRDVWDTDRTFSLGTLAPSELESFNAMWASGAKTHGLGYISGVLQVRSLAPDQPTGYFFKSTYI